MAQFARPDADVATGAWTTAPLWQKVDEATRSDADLITSANNTTGDTCELGLSDIADPAASTGHVLRYAYRKSATGGHSIDIRVRLLQGATQIASFTHTAIAATFTQANQTLSGAQADAISNYADLRVEFQRNGATGGAPSGRRSAQVSWAELEVPDAAKVVAVGQASASNAALAVARRKTVLAALAAGSEAALAVTAGRATAIGVAVASNTSLGVGHAKTARPVIAGEVDSAFAVARRKAVQVDIASAVSVAQTVAAKRRIDVDFANEVASAFAAALAKAVPLGVASEAGTAIGFIAPINIGLAGETGTAFAVVSAKTAVVGIADESAAAFLAAPGKSHSVSLATQTEAASAFSIGRAVTIGLAVDLDSGLPATVVRAVPLGVTTKADDALGVSWPSGGSGVATKIAMAASIKTTTALTGSARADAAVSGVQGPAAALAGGRVIGKSLGGEIETP